MATRSSEINSPTSDRTVWQSGPAIVIGATVTLAGLGAALTQIAQWPRWLLVVLVLLSPTIWTAARTTSILRTLAVACATLVIAAFAVAGYAVVRAVVERPSDAASSTDERAATSDGEREVSTVIKELEATPRELASDGTGLWAVVDAATLIELDSVSLNELGAPVHVGTRIEHVLMCHGRLLVTFDRGRIAEIDRDRHRVLRAVEYGMPVEAGSLNGVMACGDDAVFVARPLEAEVVRIALDSLRVVAVIPVGKRVAGLAYSNGFLYVLDSSQDAVITVHAEQNAAWRWIVTTDAPALIAGLTGSGVVVAHVGSRCIGQAVDGERQERGLDWSAADAVVLLAVGSSFGVLLDRAGKLHRFDANRGTRTVRSFTAPHGQEWSSAIVTDQGRVIATSPSRQRLITVEPGVWKPAKAEPRPATGCLH